MLINDRGREIILEFEGCALEAYKDPGGVWTIGVGHVGDVKPGMKITKHQAEVILEFDIQRIEAAVSNLAPHATGPQFSACVSLCFNIGVDAFRKSTLLKYLNEGRPVAAAAQFSKWCHAGGVVLPGLVRRRAAEAALFLTPVS